MKNKFVKKSFSTPIFIQNSDSYSKYFNNDPHYLIEKEVIVEFKKFPLI